MRIWRLFAKKPNKAIPAVYEWAEALYWGRSGKHDLAQAGDFAWWAP